MSEAAYQLSKAVPDMQNGFVIQTNYGEIRVNADDKQCDLIIGAITRLLEKRRKIQEAA